MCAGLAAALLDSCPQVRILATSREPLAVGGETVWRLDPLGPDDARRLFLERARQRRPDFLPDEATERTIEELCERLERCAAGHRAGRRPDERHDGVEILAGLDGRLDQLGGIRRQSPAHHRSVRAAVEWSYHLLDPAEQAAFRDLAVFVGGFDAEGAAAVVPGLSLELLAHLVDKSVLTTAPGLAGWTRYRQLEMVREYAHELLVASGELEAARERHFRHFLSLGQETPELWPSRRAPELVRDLEADYANVRAALEWSATADPCAGMRLLSGTLDLSPGASDRPTADVSPSRARRCPVLRDGNRVYVQYRPGLLRGGMVTDDAAKAEPWQRHADSARNSANEHRRDGPDSRGLVEHSGLGRTGAEALSEEGRRLDHHLGE